MDLSVFLHVFLFLVALAYLSAWRTRIFPCVRPGPSPGPGGSKSVNLKNGPHSSFAAQTHCGCRAAHPHGPKLQVTNSTHNIGLIQTSTKRLYHCHCHSSWLRWFEWGWVLKAAANPSGPAFMRLRDCANQNQLKRNLSFMIRIVGYFRDPMETTTWTILKDSKRIWTGSFLQWHSETRCKIRAWPREDEPSRVCYFRIYYDDIKVFPTVMSYDCDIMNYDIIPLCYAI